MKYLVTNIILISNFIGAFYINKYNDELLQQILQKGFDHSLLPNSLVNITNRIQTDNHVGNISMSPTIPPIEQQ